MQSVASTKTLIMIAVTSFASLTTNNAASDIPCMGCKSVAFEIDSLHCVFAKLGDKVKMRSGFTMPLSVFLIKLQIFISICMRGRIPLVRRLCCSQGCPGFDWGPAKTIACENIRFSSLFAAGDVSRGGMSATQRQKFHTDDVKSVRNPVRSADWSTE